MLPLKVLLIEDSERDAALILRHLERAGYAAAALRVETAAGMQAALHNPAWDIIIADYQLPEFDAPSALALLQATGQDIPFIVVSGAIGEETAAALMRAGAQDYLRKDSLARLAPVVSRELAEAQMRRERKRTEALLQLQSSALNAAANAIVIANRAGVIEWVNPAFTTLSGFTLDEAVGSNMIDEMVSSAGQDEAFYQQIQKSIQAGEVWQGEWTHRHKNGQVYIEEQTITPLRGLDGQISQFIAIKQDITARKQMEKDLRLWADAFKYCAQGIVMAYPENNALIICNPAFARMHGATLDEAAGRQGLSLFSPEVREEVSQHIAAADREGHDHFETRRLRRDGTSFPAQIELVSVRDASGRLLYRVASVEDISKRKQAEQALVKEMEESQRRARELETIAAVSTSLRQAHTRAELVEIILQKMSVLLNARAAAFAFPEGALLHFDCKIAANALTRKQQSAAGEGVFGEVMASGKPLIAGNITSKLKKELPKWLDRCIPHLGALIVYPLISEQTPIGLMLLGYDRPMLFLAEQLNLVAAVADMAGSALNRMAAVDGLEHMVDSREKELESIYQVSSAAIMGLDLHQALQEALALTLSAVHTTLGGIYLIDERDRRPELIVYQGVDGVLPDVVRRGRLDNSFLEEIIRHKKAVVLSDLKADPRVVWTPDVNKDYSFVGIPMLNQERLIGVLAIVKEGKNQVNVEEMTLLSFIADHLALVVENTRLHKRSEHSAVMEERSRLARELHDSVTQSLFSANLYASGAQKCISQKDYDRVDSYLTQIGLLAQQSLKEMRLLVYELRNAEMLKNGLISAIENRLDAVERRSGIRVEFRAGKISKLAERVEENLYRITIEALNNALKHAQASQIRVELTQSAELLRLVIQDDGCGMDAVTNAHHGGMGLTTMRERAEMLAGTHQIQSSPGNGTRIEVTVPVTFAADSAVGGRN